MSRSLVLFVAILINIEEAFSNNVVQIPAEFSYQKNASYELEYTPLIKSPQPLPNTTISPTNSTVSDFTSEVQKSPLILSDLLIINNRQYTDRVMLRYTPTPLSDTLFDKYRFMISDPNASVKEKFAHDIDTKVTFDDLIPGRLYNFTMWTVLNGVISQPLNKQDRLYPDPITRINATSISDQSIDLIWGKPRGEYDGFVVQYLNEEDELIQNSTLDTGMKLINLKPFYNYTFTIVVRSGTGSSFLRHSLPVSTSFVTNKSVGVDLP